MGCYAAFPALRLAHALCLADPHATVLVVACELCTLHAQLKTDTDSITAAALFADGAAAALVSAKPPGANFPSLKLSRFHSTLIPNSEADMSWTIGDTGFDMTLSQYVPKILESNVTQILKPVLKRFGTAANKIDHWAVHPGGKLILDKLASSLKIVRKLGPSRLVLRSFGNMSSATVFFILRDILDMNQTRPEESVVAMAFGPGLTVELALMNKVTQTTA
jgi:predicted naringenin-chalcone synthase